MTKAELVAAIAQKTGLKQGQAKDALDAMLGSVTECLKKGNEVRLVGFGSFTPVDRPAGMARNPRTGAAVKASRLQDRPLPRGRLPEGRAQLTFPTEERDWRRPKGGPICRPPFFMSQMYTIGTVWWAARGSNPRPPGCKPGALTS